MQTAQPIQNGVQIEHAEQLWQEFDLDETNDPELIQAYIAQIEKEAPLWVYKAKKRLEALEAELKAKDQAAWRDAEKTDTIDAYRAYLKGWPSGLYADKAKASIEKLEEYAAWQRAMASGEIEALQSFLSRYPKSLHAEEARSLIDQLEEAALWQTAAGAESIEALQDFLVRYPQSDHAAEARERLHKLEQQQFAAKGFVNVEAWTPQGRESRWIEPGSGKPFKDFEHGPKMVIVPKGEFLMGAPDGEKGRSSDEGPQHRVTIPAPFAIGRYAVTFDEWDAAVAAGGVDHKPGD